MSLHVMMFQFCTIIYPELFVSHTVQSNPLPHYSMQVHQWSLSCLLDLCVGQLDSLQNIFIYPLVDCLVAYGSPQNYTSHFAGASPRIEKEQGQFKKRPKSLPLSGSTSKLPLPSPHLQQEKRGEGNWAKKEGVEFRWFRWLQKAVSGFIKASFSTFPSFKKDSPGSRGGGLLSKKKKLKSLSGA